MENNKIKEHFNRELEILKEKHGSDNLIIKNYISIINNIIEIFEKEGHSGMIGPMYANNIGESIKKILNSEPLSGLNCDNDEFRYTYIGSPPYYQNIREARIFKDEKNTHPYFIDAVKFVHAGDNVFTGTVEDISSVWYIKKNPFTPVVFYIDVYKNNGEYKIKDRSQLKKIFNYYIPFEGVAESEYLKYKRISKIDKLKKSKEKKK